MSQLQVQLFGPYFSSFLSHSYCYEPANEPKSALKYTDFRFGPYNLTVSMRQQKVGNMKVGISIVRVGQVLNANSKLIRARSYGALSTDGYWR